MADQKGPRRSGKSKKSAPSGQSKKCIACGKTLAEGVRYCVSCGTYDEVELDSRVAGLDEQIRRSRERNFFHLWLSRLLFGFWRY
jgi:hypothetical protein